MGCMNKKAHSEYHNNEYPCVEAKSDTQELKSCERHVSDHKNSSLNTGAVSMLQVEIVKLETALWFKDQECGSISAVIDGLNEKMKSDDLPTYQKNDISDEIKEQRAALTRAECEAYRIHLTINRYRKHLDSCTTLPVD